MNFKNLLSFSLLLTLSSNSFADSIAQLLEQGKIPAVQTKKVGDESFITLNLSGLGIDSLVGLGKIPGIETVQVLALNDNALTILPAGLLAVCKNVTAIGLERNKISTVEAGAFAGCFKLKSINLNKNNLSAFVPGTFAGPEHLEVLSLNRNPGLTRNKKEIQRLKKELSQTKITTGPFTPKQWAVIGVAAATVALALLAAVVMSGSSQQKPALIEAAEKGELKRVTELLGQGVDVNATDKAGRTALMVAHAGVVDDLLKAPNINIDATDNAGFTALMLAAQRGSKNIVEKLLNKGADVNVVSRRTGQTALILAARSSFTEIVDALLKKQAKVNVVDKDRKTALDRAMEANNSAIVILLLDSPQLGFTRNDFNDIYSWANKNNHSMITDELRKRFPNWFANEEELQNLLKKVKE